jgi:23S rRNA (pseudouridine1915-N3)-methyltransferase
VQLKFLWIGATKNPRFVDAEEEYLKRVRRSIPCEIVSLREIKKTDPRAHSSGLNRELQAVRQRLKEDTYLVALDEAGKELTSRQFSDFLNGMMVGPIQEVAFVCGGHLGLSEQLLDQSDFRLSLSRFTLPHDLARVVLLEQVYRALSILKGLPYHR